MSQNSAKVWHAKNNNNVRTLCMFTSSLLDGALSFLCVFLYSCWYSSLSHKMITAVLDVWISFYSIMFQTDGFCILPTQRCASAGSSYGLVCEPAACRRCYRSTGQTDRQRGGHPTVSVCVCQAQIKTLLSFFPLNIFIHSFVHWRHADSVDNTFVLLRRTPVSTP